VSGITLVYSGKFRQHDKPTRNYQDDRWKHRLGAGSGDRRSHVFVVIRHGSRHPQWERLRLE